MISRHLWLALLACACDRPAAPVAREDAVPAPPASDAALRTSDASLPPVVMGPDGSEKTVFALLRGEQPASRFPVIATDDGKPVDDGLREEIAPKHEGKVKIVSVQGAPEAGVKRLLTAKLSRLQGCHSRGLDRYPWLSGTMTFELVLGEHGDVIDGKTKSASVPDSFVVTCSLERLRQMEFPRPDKPGSVIQIQLELLSEQ